MPRNPSCRNVIKGSLEISVGRGRTGIFIGGDPQGLRSLAKTLNWLADVDQEAYSGIPVGERAHTHLHAGEPFAHLTQFSANTEICRLDAKGTKEFPKYYTQSKRPRPRI